MRFSFFSVLKRAFSPVFYLGFSAAGASGATDTAVGDDGTLSLSRCGFFRLFFRNRLRYSGKYVIIGSQ